VAISATPAPRAVKPPTATKGVVNRTTQANMGQVHVHQGIRTAAMLMVVPLRPERLARQAPSLRLGTRAPKGPVRWGSRVASTTSHPVGSPYAKEGSGTP